jgi:hypothetical protein
VDLGPGGRVLGQEPVELWLRQLGAVNKGNEFGKRSQQTIREHTRCDDEHEHRKRAAVAVEDATQFRWFSEERAFGTGSGTSASASAGEAAAFVSPALLTDSIWARYRSPYRALADQLNSDFDLPPHGMKIYLPAVTTGTTVSTATENAETSEGDPVTGFSSSPVTLKAGKITLSQQFLDRVGPGVNGDQVLFQQIKEQLDAQIDVFAISQVPANAQEVNNAGTFELAKASAVGGFLGDLKKAKNKLHDLAGQRLRGTHAFAMRFRGPHHVTRRCTGSPRVLARVRPEPPADSLDR